MTRIASLAALAFAGLSLAGARAEAQAPAAEARPVLVELFTSEGCSSCPPADDALAALARSAAAKGRPIIALAWHVDYWDRLGWPDPFASPRHTARQKRYAAALGSRGLYTPQAIVDGRVDVVGSDRRGLSRAVEQAGQASTGVRLSARVERDGRRFTITPALDKAPRGARVLAALTESGLSVEVPRGENAGRTLNHAHVVRAFVEGRPGAPLVLDAPAGVELSRAEVVVWVQGADRAIIAATAIRPAS